MLTPDQIQTLKAFVNASVVPAIVAARTAGATYDLSLLLSAPATPAVKAWRTVVPAVDLDDAATYTTYDGKTQGKRDEWSILLQYAPRDMAKSKNRAVVTDVWGNATNGSIAETILLACTENANVAEVAIGGSTAGTGTVSALQRDFIGSVSQTDCQLILAA